MTTLDCCIKLGKELTSEDYFSLTCNNLCGLTYFLIYSFIIKESCLIYACRVGVRFPSIEVRFTNLRVEAECQVVRGKPLPTLWNSLKGMLPVSS